MRSLALCLTLALPLLAACERKSPPANAGGWPPGAPPPGYQPPGPGYQPPGAGYQPPGPGYPAPPPAAPAPSAPWLDWLGQVLGSGPPPLAGLPWPLPWPGLPTGPGPQPAPQPGPQPPWLPPLPGAEPSIPPRALDLANTINNYRMQRGLPPIPITRALSFVAHTHVHDLKDAPKTPGCNAHSWTNKGPWTACCYTPDHAQAECMWRKPGELTHYKSTGFEIAIGQPGEDTGYVLDSQRSLELWKSSQPHHEVIINQGKWADTTWRAMGAGIIDSHAAVWFAKDVDPLP